MEKHFVNFIIIRRMLDDMYFCFVECHMLQIVKHTFSYVINKPLANHHWFLLHVAAPESCCVQLRCAFSVEFNPFRSFCHQLSLMFDQQGWQQAHYPGQRVFRPAPTRQTCTHTLARHPSRARSYARTITRGHSVPAGTPMPPITNNIVCNSTTLTCQRTSTNKWV